MHAREVTVAIPVSDVAAAARWYERLLARSGPDLTPVPGIVEYRVAGTWLQLHAGRGAGESGWAVRIGVADVGAERARLEAEGMAPGDVVEVPGLLRMFDVVDPDRNRVTLYTLLGAERDET